MNLTSPDRLALQNEDSDRLRTTMARRLTAEGFALDAVADGAQALAFLKTCVYQLMVLDLMLPRVDGLAVLAAIAGKSMRGLVLSARDQVADRIEATHRKVAWFDKYLQPAELKTP